MLLSVGTILSVFRLPKSTTSTVPDAIKEVGSVVTWGTVQNFSELLGFAAFQKTLMDVWLRRHVGISEVPEESVGCKAPSSRGEWS